MVDIKDTSSDGLSAAISNRAMNARKQASNVIIDTREQTGVTEEIVQRGIIRAFVADEKAKKS